MKKLSIKKIISLMTMIFNLVYIGIICYASFLIITASISLIGKPDTFWVTFVGLSTGSIIVIICSYIIIKEIKGLTK